MLTFKALSVLIDYPIADIHAALEEIPQVLELEGLLPAAARQTVLELIQELRNTELVEMQENYVELFDRGRKLSLHIFEHTHGESRDRGPAMVELMKHYSASGLNLAARELPDYIPLVLEFLSQRPLDECLEVLGEAMPVLTLIGARLQEKESAYAAVFTALEAIAGAPDDAAELRERAAEEGPDESLTNIDKVWEEEAITFNEGSALSTGHTAGTTTAGAPGAMEELRWVE